MVKKAVVVLLGVVALVGCGDSPCESGCEKLASCKVKSIDLTDCVETCRPEREAAMGA